MDSEALLSDFAEQIPGCVCAAVYELETRSFVAIRALDGYSTQLAQRALEALDVFSTDAFSLPAELTDVPTDNHAREFVCVSRDDVQMLRQFADCAFVLVIVGTGLRNLGMLLTGARIFATKLAARWPDGSARELASAQETTRVDG